MAQYNGKELFVEVSSKDGRIFSPGEQESKIPYDEGSQLIQTTDVEIQAEVEYFKKYEHCKLHMVYDIHNFDWNQRYCGICGKFIGNI